MDLKRYLQVSARRWWVVLLAVLVTAGATAWRVMPAPDVYESKATFVVRPNESLAGDEIRAIDTLIRGGSINATYASIARSRLVREQAIGSMEPGTVTKGLRAHSEVVAGTNILSITVRNKDPELAHAFLDAVSKQTVAFVQGVDDAYRLEPLDPPSTPSAPVDDRANLTIALGVLLGLALGVGLAMLIEYLRSPSPGPADRADRARRRDEDTTAQSESEAGRPRETPLESDHEAAEAPERDPEPVAEREPATEREPAAEREPVAAGVGTRVRESTPPRAEANESKGERMNARITHRERLSTGQPMPAVVKDWNGVARVIRTFGPKR